jgi:hypothetical protein
MIVDATEGALESIDDETAYQLAQLAFNKLKDNLVGKFNRYLTLDNNGNPKSFLVYFESNDHAVVMSYEEALEIPVLGDKCKETWNEF